MTTEQKFKKALFASENKLLIKLYLDFESELNEMQQNTIKEQKNILEKMKQRQTLLIDSVTNCFECGEHIKPELFVNGENNQCGECHYK